MSYRSTRALLALLGLGLGSLACNDYIFYKKYPQNEKQAMVMVPAAKPTPADVLFVIDNSGSMANKQENLARNMEAFINAVAGTGDYHMAIVTTDQDSRMGDVGGLVHFTFGAPPFQTLDDRTYDTSGCMPSGTDHGCFWGPDPNKRVITSAMTKEDQIAAFKANVKIGSCGSGTERGLAAMSSALAKTAAGQCNQNFLRPDANLVVVIVSDENDSDADAFMGNAPPVAQYVNDLKRYKPAGSLRAAVVVGANKDGVGANCMIDMTTGGPNACGSLCNQTPPQGSHSACSAANPMCPAGEYCTQGGQCENHDLEFWSNCYWCSFYNVADCCTALNGNRYIEFAKALEAEIHAGDPQIELTDCNGAPGKRIGCLIDSICQTEFDKTLTRIAKDLILTNSYKLNPPTTNPSGVVVKVNGKTLVYGTDFTVSTDGSTLSITGPNAPKMGENVEIYFIVDG